MGPDGIENLFVERDAEVELAEAPCTGVLPGGGGSNY